MNPPAKPIPLTTAKKARNTGIIITLVTFGLIGVIILISSIQAAAGGLPILENPGALIGGAISSLTILLGAVLPLLLRVERTGEAVHEHVANSHTKEDGTPLYLRDDIDNLRREMRQGFLDVKSGIAHAIELSMANATDIRGIRRDVAEGRADRKELRDRVDDLEDTIEEKP